MVAWPEGTGTGVRLGVPARQGRAVPVLPRVRRVTEDLDRAIEDAVKEALERDRARQDEMRRQRETDPVESETSDASSGSDAPGDDGGRDDTAGDAACPGGEATNPDR
jgi:hypothetical protein